MSFIDTRRSMHAVAEHVLAPLRYGATGHIGLRASPHGFGTPSFPFGDGERQVVIRDLLLVDRRGADERQVSLTTLRAAADFVGVEPGVPPGLYPPATPLDLDRRLDVDEPSANELAEWFALGNEALRQLLSTIGEQPGPAIQLWPEHFDIATTIDGVDFGASPGDADHDDPYLYVGAGGHRDGRFWNESFGASLPRSAVADVAAAVGFFLEGRDLSR